MATVHPISESTFEPVQYEEGHPCWVRAFQKEIRSQQLADDHAAWAAVTGVLITIVTIGVILAAITVPLCLALNINRTF